MLKSDSLCKSNLCNLCLFSDARLRLYTMDSLAETEWDVIIAGTGLPQSLLALYVLPFP